MLNLLKVIYRVNAIQSNPPKDCSRIWQADAKIYMEVQKPKCI